ncbi:hypothetical protein, partial [Sinorhizobium fredii]|uniref:hypothetical protein n=1 Tax=Rhizobium fredii TaxID=380 RepID=UPI001AEC4DEC
NETANVCIFRMFIPFIVPASSRRRPISAALLAATGAPPMPTIAGQLCPLVGIDPENFAIDER